MDLSLIQLGVLVFCFLSLGYFSQKTVLLIGFKLTVVLGAPGIMAHEASHWIMAKLFGHKILEAKFFAPSSDGSLGYVNHAYKRSFINYISLPMISLAPLFIGPGIYYFFTNVLYPELIYSIHVGHQQELSIHIVLSNLYVISQWITNSLTVDKLVWLLPGLSIITFSVPSSIDIENCRKQLIVLIIIGCLLVHYGLSVANLTVYLTFMSSFAMLSLSIVMFGFISAYMVRRCFSS